MANISNYYFSYQGILVDGVTHPVIVCYITLDETINIGDTVSIYRDANFTNALTQYCIDHPTILSPKWGYSFDAFFSNLLSGVYGDDDNFKLEQYISGATHYLTIYYKGVSLAHYQSSWGTHSSNKCSIGVECIYIDKNTNLIYQRPNRAFYSPVPDSNRVTGNNGIPPFGINFTSLGIPYGVMVDPETVIAGSSVTHILSNYKWEDVPVPSSDPYSQGGESETSGGTGDFDGTSDSVNIPNLPSLSAVDTGFISLFNPSASQLKSLANYMWGDLFDIDTWKKIFANPMDAILGLSIVPVNVPEGGSETVSVGNISTGISMTKASSQYVAVDCGTLNVNEYWGAYLDYDPYTKAEIYLPFIGTHPLAVDDIMGKAVHVVYHVDILSGSCCAYIKCGNSVLYSFVGQCSCSIPITGNDWTNVVNGALSIAASIGTMVATGGATAPMSIANIASTAVNSLKPNVEKSGSMGGMGGMLGIQKPYLILTRPRQALPKNQNSYMGYPAFITMKLSDCSGYTEVESIHVDNVPATEKELAEIETLLKSGVII